MHRRAMHCPKKCLAEAKRQATKKEKETYDDRPWTCWSRGTRFGPCWAGNAARRSCNFPMAEKKRRVFLGNARTGGELSLTQVEESESRDGWWTLAAARRTARQYHVSNETVCLATSPRACTAAHAARPTMSTAASLQPRTPAETQRYRFP